MQPCEDRIPALVDASTGELTGPAPAELNSHLLQCPGCRAELESLRQTTALLSETSERPDEFSLSGFAVRTAERAEGFRDRSVRGLWWSITRGVRMALSVSGAALAASVTLFVMAQHPRTTAIAPISVTSSAGVNAGTAPESWEAYIPEAVRLVHENADQTSDAFVAEPVSLDDGLGDLSVDELETLTFSLNPS